MIINNFEEGNPENITLDSNQKPRHEKKFKFLNPEDLIEDMKKRCEKHGLKCVIKTNEQGTVSEIIGYNVKTENTDIKKIIPIKHEIEYIEEKEKSIAILKEFHEVQREGVITYEIAYIGIEDSLGNRTIIDFTNNTITSFINTEKGTIEYSTSYAPTRPETILNPQDPSRYPFPVDPENIDYDKLLEGRHPDAKYYEKKHLRTEKIEGRDQTSLVAIITKINDSTYEIATDPKAKQLEWEQITPEQALKIFPRPYNSKLPSKQYRKTVAAKALEKAKEIIKGKKK